jgi:hypothetical protein
METKSIKKAKVLEQIATPSIKNSPLKAGTKVITGDIVAGMSYKRGNKEITPDNILCEVDGAFVSVPVVELHKMRQENGQPVLDMSKDDVAIPASFTVKSSTDRIGTDGKAIYPAAAYKGYSAYINKADRTMEDYTALVASGLLNPDKAKAVQDYVVTL